MNLTYSLVYGDAPAMIGGSLISVVNSRMEVVISHLVK